MAKKNLHLWLKNLIMMKKLLLLLFVLTCFTSFSQTTYIFNGDGNWTDTAQWENGIYPGTTIQANAIVEITGKLTIPQGTIVTNNGTIESYNTSTQTPEITILGSLVNNKNILFGRTTILVGADGAIIMNGSSTLDLNYNSILTNTGSFVVFSGTVSISNSVSSFINDGVFSNSGSVLINAGIFRNKSDETSTKTITINNDGRFEISNGELINSGTFRNEAGSVLLNNRKLTITTTGNLQNKGQLTISGSSSSIINSGSLNNSKNINVEDYGTFNMTTNSVFTNQNTASVFVDTNSEVINKATDFNIRYGIFQNNGTINSDSTIFIGGAGNLENNGTLNSNFGSVVSNYGTLSGSNIASIGSFTNNGKLSPGNLNDPTGTYKMDGFFTSYTQTSTGSLNIDLGGTLAGNNYDQLVINRDVFLNGSLNVTLVGGFEPVIGDVFTLISQGRNVSGSFSIVNLPTLSGNKIWDVVEYSSTNGVRISVIEKPSLNTPDVSPLTFQLYPNPVSDKIFISGISENSAGNIYDSTGRKVSDVVLNQETSSVDVSKLASGIYFFKIQGESFKFLKK